MTKNIYASSIIKTAIVPQIPTGNTAIVSAIIDTKDFEYLEFNVITGTIADADVTTTFLVEGGDVSNLSDAAAIADSELENTEAAAALDFADDGEVSKIGVKILSNRYYRLTITPANNTGNLPIAAIARLAGAKYQGAVQPEA